MDETYFITGVDLQHFLNAKPQDYTGLYPGRFERGYCPCEDLLIENGGCQKMLTAMNVLRKGIDGFPRNILPVTGGKYRYKTGDLYIDDKFNVAYLYLGKLQEGKFSWQEKDVVINLGGETGDFGKIQITDIDCAENNTSIMRKVFPPKDNSDLISKVYFK